MLGTILAIFSGLFYQDFFRFYISIKKRSAWALIFNEFVIGYILICLFGFAVHLDTITHFQMPELWKQNIIKNCGQDDIIIANPETANFQKFYLGFSLIGTYLGVIFEQKVLFTRKYPFFYDTDLITSIKRVIVCFLVGSPTLLTMFISKNNPYWIIIIFKTWLPPTLAQFYLFGLSKSVAYFFGLCNTSEAKSDAEILYYMDPDEAINIYKGNKIN